MVRSRKAYNWYWSLWRKTNPEKKILYAARNRAKKQNIEYNIDLDDIKIPEICPVLGIPIRIQGDRFLDSPSLDRIDSSKGYIKGNIHVISGRANILKRDSTLKELELLVKYLRKFQCAL